MADEEERRKGGPGRPKGSRNRGVMSDKSKTALQKYKARSITDNLLSRKVLSLHLKDLPQRDISKALGIQLAKVNKYLQEWEPLLDDINRLGEWSHAKSNILEAAQARILKSLLQNIADNPRNNAFTLAKALDIVHNISRLENNQSTQNIEIKQHTYVEVNVDKYRPDD